MDAAFSELKKAVENGKDLHHVLMLIDRAQSAAYSEREPQFFPPRYPFMKTQPYLQSVEFPKHYPRYLKRREPLLTPNIRDGILFAKPSYDRPKTTRHVWGSSFEGSGYTGPPSRPSSLAHNVATFPGYQDASQAQTHHLD